MITEDHDELFDRIRGNLGEHFNNYMFIVMDDDGDLFYDYTNFRVGKMLVDETQKDMEGEVIDIWWDDDDELDEVDGTDI